MQEQLLWPQNVRDTGRECALAADENVALLETIFWCNIVHDETAVGVVVSADLPQLLPRNGAVAVGNLRERND